MQTSMIVLIVAMSFLVVSAITWRLVRNHRSENLRRRFGIEHGHAVKANGSRSSDEAAFVDNPAVAASEAETLVNEVMRARGYPMSDSNQRAVDLSADHPRFVANYREARELALAYQRGAAQTEDLKRATPHYGELFEDLLDTAERKDVDVHR